MSLTLPRRRFLTGMAALVCAPAIIRVATLMPIKPWADPVTVSWYQKRVGNMIDFGNPGLYLGNQDNLSIEDVGNGWQRISHKFTPSSPRMSDWLKEARGKLSQDGDLIYRPEVKMVQIEQGNFIAESDDSLVPGLNS